MCHMQALGLENNKIGDVGVTALAEACAAGALPALKTLGLYGNPASSEAQQAANNAIKNRK